MAHFASLDKHETQPKAWFGVRMDPHCGLEKAKIGLSNKDKESRGTRLGLNDQLATESPHYFKGCHGIVLKR